MAEKLYICPGETHPISRAVHLSRLAAFYPKCRDCPLRVDTGQLPTQLVERLQSTERRVRRSSLFTTEGVRAVYVNEMTRHRAGEIAAALAGLLWARSPLPVASDRSTTAVRCQRPMVVIGHDERPSSPDIVCGVAVALRRMGCHVIDVGLTSSPCFRFAVQHLDASAGVHVTGSGCAPSWTGMDFIGRGGIPLSQRPAEDSASVESSEKLDLNAIEAAVSQPRSRPARTSGPQRTFRVGTPYEAGLLKHYHALRPLTVCCGTAAAPSARALAGVFAQLSCRLIDVLIPQRERKMSDPSDSDVQRIGAAVVHHQAHLGVLIDDDGGRVAFLDEHGELADTSDISRLLCEVVLSDEPQGKVVIEDDSHGEFSAVLAPLPVQPLSGGTTLNSTWASMQQHGAVLGCGRSGRYWLHESTPTCDAILTLARMLQALSRSDTPFSQLCRRAA